MTHESENIVLERLQAFHNEFTAFCSKVNNEFLSFRTEVSDEFKKVDSRAQSFRNEVHNRFDLVDNKLFQHDSRLSQLEQGMQKQGLLLEDTSNRMELAGEGIESILETVQRLVLSDQQRKHYDIRIDAFESWAQNHQRSHDEGKV